MYTGLSLEQAPPLKIPFLFFFTGVFFLLINGLLMLFGKLDLINPNEKSTIRQDYQTLKVIDQIAKDNKITPFEVDKIFWLIGSGNFYLSEINIGRNRDEFIKKVKSTYPQQCI